MSSPAVVSFDLRNFESSGLISKVNVRVKESRFVIWQYPTGTTGPGIFVKLTLDLLSSQGGDVTGEGIQYLSAGKQEYFTISEDSKFLIPGERSAPMGKTNLHVFLETASKFGFPIDYLANGDISRLEGMEFYADSVKAAGVGDNPKDYQQFVCAGIHRLPGDAGKPKGGKPKPAAAAGTAAPAAAAPASTPAPAAAAGGSEEDAQLAAVSLIQQYLSAEPANPPLKVVTAGVNLTKPFSKDPTWQQAYPHLKSPAAVKALVAAQSEMLVIVGEGAAAVIQLPA